MSIHNDKTLEGYKKGGAKSYIKDNIEQPEQEKWDRLFKYVVELLNGDTSKRIVEFGSGFGQIALMLQEAGYDVTASDADDDFLENQRNIGVNKVQKFNFLKQNFAEVFGFNPDLILSWRNPHLDKDDVRSLFKVAHDALADDGLFVVNLQNLEVHSDAEVLPNGTRYNYKILDDRPNMPERFFAYYTMEDINEFIDGLFTIGEYHTEGGSEKKNWHVGAYVKVKK